MRSAAAAETLETRTLLTSPVTYVVDTLADDPAGLVGDTDGKISLREAVLAANTDSAFGDAVAGAGADIITFDPGLAGGTITLGGQELLITDDLQIVGLGAENLTVSGGGLSRVFRVDSASVHLAHFTISDGLAQGGDGGDTEFGGGGGGGTGMGGAIFVNSGSNVVVQNMILFNNSAVGGDGGSSGVPGAGNNGGAGGASSLGDAGGTAGTSGVGGGNSGNFGAGGGGGYGSAADNVSGTTGGRGTFGGGGGGGGGGGINGGGTAFLSAAGGAQSQTDFNDGDPSNSPFLNLHGIGNGRAGSQGLVYSSVADDDVFTPTIPPGTGGGGSGGAGLGGAIFVRDSGVLTVVDTYFARNDAVGGSPGNRGDNVGLGKGGAIFAMDGSTVQAQGISFGNGSIESNFQSTPNQFPSNPANEFFGFNILTQNNDVFGNFSPTIPAITYVDGPASPSYLGQPYLNFGVYDKSSAFGLSPAQATAADLIARLGRQGIREEMAVPSGLAITAVDDSHGVWLVNDELVSSTPAVLINLGDSFEGDDTILFKAIGVGAELENYQFQIIDSGTGGGNAVALEGNILTYRVDLGAGFSALEAVNLLQADAVLSALFSARLVYDGTLDFDFEHPGNDGSGNLAALAMAVDFNAAYISESNALLADSSATIEFFADNRFNTLNDPAPTVTLRGWDGTGGVAGSRADTTTNGPTTPFTTTVTQAPAEIVDGIEALLINGAIQIRFPQDTLFDAGNLPFGLEFFPMMGNEQFRYTITGVGGVWSGGPVVTSVGGTVQRSLETWTFNVRPASGYTALGTIQFGALTAGLPTGINPVNFSQRIFNANIAFGNFTNMNTDSGPMPIVRDYSDLLAGVTHFKVTNIQDGTLFSDPTFTTPVNDGDFIDFANGNVYLYMRPDTDFVGDATFEIQKSTSNDDSGLVGDPILQYLTVDAVADTVTAPDTSTPEGTLTSPITVTRVAGQQVGANYVHISNITNGTLYRDPEKTMPVSEGDFFVLVGGELDLYFEPLGDDSVGSFDVQAATDPDVSALVGSVDTVHITVTNVAPTITGLSLTSSSINENQSTTLNGTFFDPGTADSFTVTINWGDGSSPTVLNLPAGSTSFSASHVYLDDDPTGTASDVKNISVAVVDDDAGATTNNSLSVTVNNVAPTIDSVWITGVPVISEGGNTSISGLFTDPGTADTYTVTIDWGDGSTPTTLSLPAGSTSFNAGHTYVDDNPSMSPVDLYTITVVVADDDLGSSSDSSQTVMVLNTAPQITSASLVQSSILENGTVQLDVTFTDLGAADTFSVTISWGDSSPPSLISLPAGSTSFTAYHTYVDDNPSGTGTDNYSISVLLQDDDLGTDFRSGIIAPVTNVAPQFDSLGLTSSTISEGDTATLNGTFHDPGTADTYTVTIDWGDGSTPTVLNLSAGSTSLSTTHVYADDDPTGTLSDVYSISVTLADDDGGSVSDNSLEITVNNVAPTFDTLYVVSDLIDENQTAVLNGTFSDPGINDSFQLLVDWGDGSAPSVVNLTAGSTSFSVSHVYLDDNPSGSAIDTYQITATLFDDDLLSAVGAPVSIQVANVAPALTGLSLTESVIDEGDTTTLIGTFTDPGTADTYAVTIDWGDGTTPTTLSLPAGSTSFSASHTYVDDNPSGGPAATYGVSVTVTDDDSGSVTDTSLNVLVNNVAPVITGLSLTADSINENQSTTLNGTFSDPGVDDTFTVVIDWGDGSTLTTLSLPAGSTSFSASHTYLDDDPTGTASDSYNITVILADDDTGLATDTSLSVSVANVAPEITGLALTASEIDEGDTTTLNGTFTDPGTADTYTIVIDWGDGSTPTTLSLPGGSTSFSASHTYVDDNPTVTSSDVYNVSVTLSDDDLGSVTDNSVSVTVNNVAPVITSLALTADTIDENQTTTLNGIFSDVGLADSFTVVIDWGDGSAPTTLNIPAGTNDFSSSHTYLDDNPTATGSDIYQITVTVTDDDSGSTTDTSVSVTVNNVAPVLVVPPQVISWAEGAGNVTITGSYSDVGTEDTQLLTIDWRDGTVETVAVSGGTFSVTHYYLDDSPTGTPGDIYTPIFTLVDDDGGEVTVTGTVAITVSNVAPSMSASLTAINIVEGQSTTINGTFTDPGVLDTFTLTINWGDGSAPETVSLGVGVRTFSVSHVYADDNPSSTNSDLNHISLSLTDDDTGTAVDNSLAVLVSNVAPTLDTVNLTPSISEDGVVTLSGTYSDPAGDNDTYLIQINWNDGSPLQTVVVSGGAFAGITHQYLDDDPTGTTADTYSVTVSLLDDDDGIAVTTRNVTVYNVPPSASITGAPGTSVEGATITLSGSSTDVGTLDTVISQNWSVTRNGLTFASGTGASFSFTPDDNGTYVVTYSVTDDDNGVGTATASIVVTNLNPTLDSSLVSPSTITEGQQVVLSGTYSDPGAGDTHQLQIDWGDGSALQTVTVSGGSFAGINHIYVDDNPTATGSDDYVVSLTLLDDDGGSVSTTHTVTVNNANPVVTFNLNPTTINENSVVTLTGTYTDAGLADTHTATIDWGDGSPVETITVTGGVIVAAHQYLDDNPTGTTGDVNVVTVTITDDDGGVGTATRSVTVNNVVPTASIIGAPPTSPEGTAISLTSSVSDVGSLDTFTYAWSVTRNSLTYASGSSSTFSFTPDDNGTYVITLVVTDDDLGTSATATETVIVTNVVPVVNVNLSLPSIDENGSVTLTGTYSDVGTADTHTLTVNWGDGSAPQTISVAGGTFSIAHQYLDDDPSGTASDVYAISVTLTDDDGGTATTTSSVTVNNVAPTASIVGAPGTGTEGTAISLSSSVSDVGTLDTQTRNWTVTRNGDPYAAGTGNSFSFTPDDDGSYVVTLTVTDDDTGTISDVVTIAVGNVVPTVAITGPGTAVRGQELTYTLTAADASSVDAGSEFTFEIDWDGDGNVDQVVTGPSGTQVSHTYATAGERTIQVTATDKDNGTSTVSTLDVDVVEIAIVEGRLLISGDSGNDKISVSVRRNGDLVIRRNGVVVGTFNPTDSGITSLAIYGGSGNDRISVPASLTMPVYIDGGDGNDNIKGGASGDILIGGAGNDVITGRGGNDIILGGEGNDYIHGQGGQDIIIGGLGADELFGNGVGDLLIGGETVYDNDVASLRKIREEWTSDSSVNSLENRIEHIKDGTGATGGVQLRPGIETIDDGAVDKLHVKNGANWVLQFVTDRLFGRSRSDRVN